MKRYFQRGSVAAYQHVTMLKLHYKIAHALDECLPTLEELDESPQDRPQRVHAVSAGPNRRIKNSLRHRILTTCGDANIEYEGNKKADPALCLYTGTSLIYISDNKKMNEKTHTN